MPTWEELVAWRRAREEFERNAVQSLFHAIACRPTPKQEQQVFSWIRQFGFVDEMRSAYQQEQERILGERLKGLGIAVAAAYNPDSSDPTAFTLTHGDVRAEGPTLALALLAFVEQLLPKPSRES